jgi:hypothetical protein
MKKKMMLSKVQYDSIKEIYRSPSDKGCFRSLNAAKIAYQTMRMVRAQRRDLKGVPVCNALPQRLAGYKVKKHKILAAIEMITGTPEHVEKSVVKAGTIFSAYWAQSYGERYSSRYNHPIIFRQLIVTIPTGFQWSGRVIDGLMTVTEGKAHKVTGITVSAASWMQKGRGFEVNVASGYIAQHGFWSYHADSAKAAVTGLQFKIAKAAKKAKIAPGTLITRDKYRELTGACMAGIDNFVHMNGLAGVDAVAANVLLPMLKGQYGENKFRAALGL